MSPQELFSLLIINDIEFNGDVELTDDGILWSFSIENPQTDGDDFTLEEELIEALEEDLEYINDVLDYYEECMVDVDVEELQIDNSIAFADLVIVELEVEKIEE